MVLFTFLKHEVAKYLFSTAVNITDN